MIDSFKNIPLAYELISEEYIEEVKSYAGLLKHKKTGARLVVLSNEDDNKVFDIGFRTPPSDSTGVPHILEHSVLCGSREFPAKDPFVELVKGSLNTFLNAMTYADKTVYPVASCNAKDFQNLMHVYLDAVFYPNIYKNKKIFLQEGWHYELANKDDKLTYNGVVYNEMKGAFSSPEQVLFRKITATLFPENIYGVESGGDPDFIPELTYEQFLDFHSRYYHPSNSYIYLYGDFDVNEKLDFIDEHYLSHFDYLKIDSTIRYQKPFKEMQVVKEKYAVSESESEKDNTYFSYNVVIENSLNKELYLAFQILTYVLMSAPGAPLKKALIEANIAKDVLGEYDNGVLQPYISIIAKNANPDKQEAFMAIIKETLEEIVRKGVNEKSLEGAMNYYEFKFKEADYGRYPTGLMYGLKILDSWLYDEEQPFIHIKANKTFEWLRSQIGTGYYETLIEKYFLNNTHASLLVLEPTKGMTKAKEDDLGGKLAEFKASLNENQINQIVEDTKALKAYQSEASTKEELEAIPMLAIDDITKAAPPLCNELIEAEDIPVLRHPIDTNGIGYMKLLFDTKKVPSKLIPYIGLLSSVLGNIDTKSYTYTQLTDEVNLHTGGIHTDLVVYGVSDDHHEFLPRFEVNGKALFPKMGKTVELIEEIVFTSRFEDTKRIQEIIAQLKSRLQMHLNANGHVAAATRALSYSSESCYYKELTGGIAFYQFIEALDQRFEEMKNEISENLILLSKYIFRKENLLIDYTANDEGFTFVDNQIAGIKNCLYTQPVEEHRFEFVPEAKNEAFITSGMVQYDAVSGNFIDKGYQYNGALNVLRVIMNYDYLWSNIRVKGGAYGCMCSFSMNGDAYFTSYRDPNLKETYDIYKAAADYIRHLDISDRDMTKYMIGAISNIDIPLSPAAKGARSLGAYMAGTSYDKIQETREQLLSATKEDIRQFADLIDAFVGCHNICVIGSETQIKKNEHMFEAINHLFN